MAPKPQTFDPATIAPPKPTYSHISTITVGPLKLIAIAGQIGTSPSGEIPSSYHEQVSFALQNVKLCLEAAGATTRDIMKVTHYIVNFDPEDRGRGEIYMEFMGDHRPPSTLVPVEKLADVGLLYEIEVMAVVAVDERG